MARLQTKRLRGGYGDIDILNGVDLTLNPGEILTVAGTNGAGKSTLAKAIVGLLPRVSGRILLGGADLAGIPAERRARSGIGYVPQVANVFPSLTVIENLEVYRNRLSNTDQRLGILADLYRPSGVEIAAARPVPAFIPDTATVTPTAAKPFAPVQSAPR